MSGVKRSFSLCVKNDSTDEESERNVYSRDNKIAETENISHTEAVELSSHDQLESGGETDLNLETTATETYKKVLELSSEQLVSYISKKR